MGSFSTARLSVLGSLAVALAGLAGATGCSGGADAATTGDSASSATTETALSTHLLGLYEATTAGDIAWISFSEPNVYAIARGDDDCNGDDVPVTCASVGTYTIDANAKTIALADARTGTTTTLPIAAVATTTAAPVSLTQSVSLDDGLVSGSSGSIVNNSSAPLVTPGGLSLTTSSGNQSLVSTPSDAGSCGSSGSGGSSSGSSGGMCTGAGASGSQDHGHGPSVQVGGVLGALGSACSNAALVCSLCANLMNPLALPSATDIMQTTFMQCTIGKKKSN